MIKILYIIHQRKRYFINSKLRRSIIYKHMKILKNIENNNAANNSNLNLKIIKIY